jgi:S-adenosylmethionine:diacylglycerol 3-amino-3-carboxypropyl transferase
MYEDPAIELRAFAGRERVFAIASAGCTARALAAAGHRVTAVDVNPRQLGYARARAEGAPDVEGTADRLLAAARRSLGLIGWTHARLDAFLRLDNLPDQRAYWRTVLDTARWRAAIDAVLSRAVLRMLYPGALLRAVPAGFGPVLRARVARCCSMHRNHRNPYLRGLLRGDSPAPPAAPRERVEFVCADAAQYLESCPPASFDAFTFSNILDGSSRDYVERLWAAVGHAASPRAAIVLRSFAEPDCDEEEHWAAQDRSGIWGRIHVEA